MSHAAGSSPLGETVQVVALVGNPKPSSRTLGVAEKIASAVADRCGGVHSRTIDLAAHADQVLSWPSAVMDEAIASVTRADVLVVASPTYKASYTGLLKAFLDRIPTGDLRGVWAVPVMTGGGSGHAMASEVFLRPVLTELGAGIITTSVYAGGSAVDEPDPVVTAWLADNESRLALLTRSGRPANLCGR